MFKIVPEWSATLDGFKVKREAIPGKDHRDMARFASKAEEGYMIVSSYLQACLKKHSEEHENSKSWFYYILMAKSALLVRD